MLDIAAKFLVISTVSDKSLHLNWSRSENYDTCLIYYGDGDGFPGDADFYLKAKGPKFTLIHQVLTAHPDWLARYHYFWFPDDDVWLSEPEVSRLFVISRNYNLHLSQPSIIGYYGPSGPLCSAGTLLRYTNWVEIMCPCMSRYALKKCLPTFTENKTGWSIDAVWNVLLGHPKDKIAIIDDTVAVHTRPVFGGDVYQQLDGDNPLVKGHNDAYPIRLKYNLDEETAKDVGQPLGQGEIYNTVVYGSVPKDMEDGCPRNERFWPPCELLKRCL